MDYQHAARLISAISFFYPISILEYCRSLLNIYFKYSNVYMWIPNSLTIPSSPSNRKFIWVCFCPCEWIHLCLFLLFRFYVLAMLYNCLSFSDLRHLVWQFQCLCMLLPHFILFSGWAIFRRIHMHRHFFIHSAVSGHFPGDSAERACACFLHIPCTMLF